jgi:hypothetical protein
MFTWRELDEDSPAGEAKPKDADASGKSGATDAGSDAGGTTADKKTGGKETTPSDKDKTPTVEELQEQLSKLTGEHDKLKTKIGKQSEQVGLLKKLNKSLDDDPVGFIKAAAEKKGIKIRIGDEAESDLRKALKAEDDEGRLAILKKIDEESRDEKLKADILKEVGGSFKVIREENLAKAFPDWDDLAEDRENVELAIVTGSIDRMELTHLAARGKNLAGAIADAKKAGREEYIAELQEKEGGQIDAGGGKKPSGGKEEKTSIVDALDALSSVR